MKGGEGCLELGECGGTGGVAAVSGDATVDCGQCTSLVGMTSTEANCRYTLGGVLGGSVIIWGISGGSWGRPQIVTYG